MRQYQPALLGGLFIGVFSSLPVVNFANLCCCLWVVAGGVLTTYLLQQGQSEPVEAAAAALSGLLAGFIGGALYSMVMFAFTTGTDFEEQLRYALDSNPQVPAEFRDRMLTVASSRGMALMFVVVMLPVYAVFAMLGALLGVSFFRKASPPPAPGA